MNGKRGYHGERVVVGDKVVIPLNLGATTFVDIKDGELLKDKALCFNGRYVEFSVPTGTGYDKYKKFLLHRFLMGSPEGMQVDHIDGNKLNNCRGNLRVCTHSENRRNQKPRSDSRSRFKGVIYHPGKRLKRWQAMIKVDGKPISLKYHETEEKAALAYNEAALIYHGEFARLNEVQ